MNRSSGFGLIETIVVVGIIAVVGLGLAELMNNTFKAQNMSKVRSDAEVLVAEVRNLLSSSQACRNSFGPSPGPAYLANPASTYAVAALRDGSSSGGVIRYATNTVYGDQTVHLASMNLSGFLPGADVTRGEMNLTLSVTAEKDVIGPKSLSPRVIKISVEREPATGAIVNCVASAIMTDGLWRRSPSNVENIYFTGASTGGNVAIGTASPSNRFHLVTENLTGTTVGDDMFLDTYSPVVGTAPALIQRRARGSELSPLPVRSGDTLGAFVVWGHRGAAGFTSDVGGMYVIADDDFDVSTRTKMRLTTSNGTIQNQMVLASDGKVGIGNENPLRTLHVTSPPGTLGPFALTTSDFVFNTTGSIFVTEFGAVSGNTYTMLGALSQGGSVWGNLILQGAAAGNVGIGTTSPTTRLQVEGLISPASDNVWSLGSASLRFTSVYATNGTIQTSDARLKTDVQPSDLGLEFINRLRPISFKWNHGPDKGRHYGLIAQEAEKEIEKVRAKQNLKVEPSLVVHDKATDRYGLLYTELIAPLIKAVQELFGLVVANRSQIENVRQELQELRAANVELRRQMHDIRKARDCGLHDASDGLSSSLSRRSSMK